MELRLNLIGKDAYVKNCSIEDRWSLEESENQAASIAKAVRPDCINIRQVQGRYVGDEKIYLGDNFGRIAEGLSLGKIQLQPHESKKPLSERKWTSIPTNQAQGWQKTVVCYVYPKDGAPSENLRHQARENPSRTLYGAGEIFPNQYAGLTDCLRFVIGDQLKPVVDYLQGKPVNEL